MREFYPDGRPKGSVMDDFINAIRLGQVSLRALEDSGWHEYQIQALEPLLLPEISLESERLETGAGYRQILEELFRALYSLTRETHFAQLHIEETTYLAGPPTVDIAPRLRVEPLVTHYLLRAESYRFIMELLKDHVGVARLEKMHRWTADGPVEKDLASELVEIESLFRGMAFVAAEDLGLPLHREDGDQEKERWALHWLEKRQGDSDASKDTRMMVPISWDTERGVWRVWCLLGYQEDNLRATFRNRPQVEVRRGGRLLRPGLDFKLDWRSYVTTVDTPWCVEMEVRKLLTRPEFQKVCDTLPSDPDQASAELVRRLGALQ